MEAHADTGIYCRLSLAVFGDTAKVDDQERICRGLARARDWSVAPEHVWKDNNVSAWRRGVRRPGWDAMLEAVEAGRIGRLIVYHGDRLVRQPFDLEKLLNLVEDRGLLVVSPTGTRDLSVAEDRFILRILVAHACMESENTSRRKKAGFERLRLKGKAPIPGGQGGRAFGYEADGRTVREDEARALRFAGRRLLKGDSLAGVCRALTARGVTSTTGRPLTYDTLRRILLRPRTAGLLADGTKGNWTPALPRPMQQRLRALFATVPPVEAARMKHLLSGIALCGACRKPLQIAAPRAGGRDLAYGCRAPGCRKVARNLAHLDLYVSTRLVGLLNTPGYTALLAGATAAPERSSEVAALTARRDEALEVLGTLAGNPGASAAMLARSIAEFERRIAALRAQDAAGARAHLLGAYAGITLEEFRALPLATRRAMIRAAYTVTVHPSGRRGPGFSPDDVDVTLRED